MGDLLDPVPDPRGKKTETKPVFVGNTQLKEQK